MDLIEFIEQTEKAYFRTNMDTGANMNALFVWNRVREFAGLPELTHDDLSQRHADTRPVPISLEAQKADEAAMRRITKWQSDIDVLRRHGVPKEYHPAAPWDEEN